LTIVLDASALLAEFHREPGGERVTACYPDVAASAVNVGEIVTKLTERGVTAAETEAIVRQMRCPIVPFDTAQALLAGQLRATTRRLGLSFGDRACLALALTIRARSVVTTDHAWALLDLGLDVQVIR
jgi:PIN domain nuclease of toxin-antitoxin system